MFIKTKTSNPALTRFEKFQPINFNLENTMSISGTINKTFILILLTLVSAGFSWYIVKNLNFVKYLSFILIISALSGFIISIITIFNPSKSPITSILYAIVEGIFLGVISFLFESFYQGIVFKAIFLTFGIALSMLLVYKSGLIKITQKFKFMVITATFGVGIFYLFSFILSFFGITNSLIYGNSTFSIIFSLIIIFIATLNLVLDFNFVIEASESGFPAYFEWYAGFSILITLIWLYLEILRLLGKLSRE